MKPGAKCLIVTGLPAKPTISQIEDLVLCSTFALNCFRSKGCAVFGSAYVLSNVKKLLVREVIPLELPYGAQSEKFVLDPSARPDEVKALFQALMASIQSHAKFRHSLSRFNGALLRHHREDKIVDIAISLESIIGAQSEVSYRFSLNIAQIAETDPAKRADIYSTLRSLYNQRSNIVHGNSPLDATWFDSKWEEIVRVAKLALIRKADFLKDKPHAEWGEHLDKLALGAV